MHAPEPLNQVLPSSYCHICLYHTDMIIHKVSDQIFAWLNSDLCGCHTFDFKSLFYFKAIQKSMNKIF